MTAIPFYLDESNAPEGKIINAAAFSTSAVVRRPPIDR
jgi:hypothetical protein